MPQNVLTGGQSGTLRRGLRDAFDNAYESAAAQTAEELTPVMALDLPSDTDREFYSYFKHAPYPRYWARGQNVVKAGFEAVQFNVINYDYGLEVEWHKNDENDNQNTTGIRKRAADTGTNFAYNRTDAFFDMLLGTTNFLPAAIGNAPDGAALFATTDGAGNARFGATNGNLLTSTGNNSFSSASVLRGDIWRGIEQMVLFQNTEGKPLWPRAQLTDFVLYFGVGNWDVFAEAFLTNFTPFTTVTNGNIPIDNSLKAAGMRIEGRAVPQITDNDAFLFWRNAPQKALFHQMRQAPEEQPFDESNSKESARNLLRSMVWHERAGYGLFLPYSVVKLNGT